MKENLLLNPSVIVQYLHLVEITAEHNMLFGATGAMVSCISDVLASMRAGDTANGFRPHDTYKVLDIPDLREYEELGKDERLGLIAEAEEKLKEIKKRQMRLEGKWGRTMRSAERIMTKDPLTGIMNRRAFEATLDEAIRAEERRQELMQEGSERRAHAGSAKAPGIVLIDIDMLKGINDSYGHPQGDNAIKYVTRTLSTSFRATDSVARYGGEEFIGLITNVTPQQLKLVAEKARKNIANGEIPEGKNLESGLDYEILRGLPPEKVTVSIGCVIYIPGTKKKELLAIADKALYYSKKYSEKGEPGRGRNRATAAWEIGLQSIVVA